jgi:hypothetical protein
MLRLHAFRFRALAATGLCWGTSSPSGTGPTGQSRVSLRSTPRSTANFSEHILIQILSAIFVLNATLGWWWADPLAALVIVPIIAKEGVEGIRGRSSCGDCRP